MGASSTIILVDWKLDLAVSTKRLLVLNTVDKEDAAIMVLRL
jgi:hypothetical protein